MHGTSSATLLLQWASHTMIYGTRTATYLLVNPSARQCICTGATLLHNDMHATAHPHPSASLATIASLNTLAALNATTDTEPQSLRPHTPASAPAPPTDLLTRLTPQIRKVTISVILWSGPAAPTLNRRNSLKRKKVTTTPAFNSFRFLGICI